jgi:hypothetical protein
VEYITDDLRLFLSSLILDEPDANNVIILLGNLTPAAHPLATPAKAEMAIQWQSFYGANCGV